ncbi:hypothetical protein H257_06147 [Aphanomyces astaci]|uniref:Uncharacterized protein n=1 Tax=Aphanomyces astaci TaxID=112090 RepID=W4GLT5_APHAT|nr:hypothetical protein H257_06147 [Aphanomyces astaci]ETV80622.1 hypothetical protein H257_06147 [Aphanomyces astaci]|eukprot:XP_009829569.1 hypothetical protein H257_06147 [Aphanomyces astaci]
MQSRSQFAAVTHTVAVPTPPPQAMSQPGGSYHVLNAFTTPAYAYHDCVKTPGKSCFYGGVASHTLPMCPTLNRANLSATQCVLTLTAHALPIAVATTAMTVEGLVARVVSVAVVAQTAGRIMLVVMTVALVVTTVTTAALLMMQSTVTLDAVVLSLLPTTPSYHPPTTLRPPLASTPAPASALTLAPVTDEPALLPAKCRSPGDAGDLDFAEVPSNEVLVTDRLHLYPSHSLFQIPSNPTKVDLPLFPPSAFLAACSDVITAASETPIKSGQRTWDVTREIIPSAKVPVVGYGTISMLENMSSRDQVDDIRPCTLRLNFGLHRPDIQFSLFSVRQASDDDITVRLPASVMCETTTFIGDVLNAPNNAMDLYSFISKPKFVPTHPHHWESLHISDLTRFRAMMA